MTAVERLLEVWEAFDEREATRCPLKVIVHKGTLNAYRSYVYGRDVFIPFSAEAVVREAGVYVTDAVRNELTRSPWAARLERVLDQRNSPRLLRRFEGVELYRLVRQAR
jgi:hypothetical protein